MFEHQTYEDILQRLLGRVREKYPDVDTREGSVAWISLAPAAAELQEAYIALDIVLNETFGDTASREYLIRRAFGRGLSPDEASYGVFKGAFNIDVPIGSRFSLENYDYNYTVTERVSQGVFHLRCETLGAEPNQFLGTLIPIEYINGLTSAQLTELLIPGEDEEETEQFRQKYFNSFNSQAFGGNRDDYVEKVSKISGVGGVKVYRAWNGGGTVKLVIIDSDYNKPSNTLVDYVQEMVDPIGSQGEGLGTAPIDHIVTIFATDEAIIDMETQITFENGWTWDDVKENVDAALDDYYYELRKSWAQNKNLIVRISQIETRILNLPGVIDISNTKINGLSENLMLGENSIPVRGVVSG